MSSAQLVLGSLRIRYISYQDRHIPVTSVLTDTERWTQSRVSVCGEHERIRLCYLLSVQVLIDNPVLPSIPLTVGYPLSYRCQIVAGDHVILIKSLLQVEHTKQCLLVHSWDEIADFVLEAAEDLALSLTIAKLLLRV